MSVVDEHVAVQNRMQVVAQAALSMFEDEELEAFIARCEQADTVAPFLDPTAWMAGHDKLAEVTRHARALVAYRKALRNG